MNIEKYWQDVLRQDEAAIRSYFNENAFVNWHCTNEHFTASEFIKANCEYPGEWQGEIESKFCVDNAIITITHVYTKDKTVSFHVTSVIKVENDKIISIDEYWGEDCVAPTWRLDKKIGERIIK